MDIKLIAIDIDGTLLNEKTNWRNQRLTRSLKPAITALKSSCVPADRSAEYSPI